MVVILLMVLHLNDFHSNVQLNSVIVHDNIASKVHLSLLKVGHKEWHCSAYSQWCKNIHNGN